MKNLVKKVRISRIFVFLALLIMTISFLYPIFFMIINALKSKPEYLQSQFSLPSGFLLENFRSILIDFKILTYFKNSLFLAGMSTALITLFSVFASYAFAKLNFKGKNIVYIALLSTIFLPGQVSMVPTYVMFSKMGLVGSPWAVILIYLAGGIPGAVLLMTGAFHGISNEMIESAKLDGAGYFDIVFHIIFPMGMSAIAISIIFSFIGYWNDLLTPMLYLSDVNKQPVMVALTGLVQKTSSLPTRQMAGLFISILPAIFIYLFLQKYIVKGMAAGSLK